MAAWYSAVLLGLFVRYLQSNLLQYYCVTNPQHTVPVGQYRNYCTAVVGCQEEAECAAKKNKSMKQAILQYFRGCTEHTCCCCNSLS
jgi:hypothetical protein